MNRVQPAEAGANPLFAQARPTCAWRRRGSKRRNTIARMHREDEAPVAVRLSITGRVQGVVFRASLRAQATAHGLRGWTRNRADGSVEAVLSGAPEAIEAVVRWAARGPDGARVDRVEREAYPEAVEEGFQIRPTL